MPPTPRVLGVAGTPSTHLFRPHELSTRGPITTGNGKPPRGELARYSVEYTGQELVPLPGLNRARRANGEPFSDAGNLIGPVVDTCIKDPDALL